MQTEQRFVFQILKRGGIHMDDFLKGFMKGNEMVDDNAAMDNESVFE